MSVRINGSGEYLKRTTSLPGNTSFTVCAWARWTKRTGGIYQYLIGFDNAVDKYCLIGFNDSFGEDFHLTTANGYQTFVSTPSDETWFFVAITYNGTSAIGYYAPIGATAFETVTQAMTSFTPSAMLWGNDGFDEYCNAGLFSIKAYNAVLTEAELWQEMNSIRPHKTENLNVWAPVWDINDIKDYSGLGNDLSSGGTITSEDNPPISWGAPVTLLPYAAPAVTGWGRLLDMDRNRLIYGG